MAECRSYEYSKRWKLRNIIAFCTVTIFVYVVMIASRGLLFVIEEPFTPVFFITLIWLGNIKRIYRERRLTKKVEIVDREVKIDLFNGKQTSFKLDDICEVKILDSSKSINGFGVKEILVTVTGMDSYNIPVNIKGFSDLLSRFPQER